MPVTKPTTTGTPLVYSYVRFSTGEQRKGTGKVRQDSLAEQWCADNGHALCRNYADLGVSAFKGRNATHGELSRFLECVRRGHVQTGSILLVESLDRLSRQNINNALETFLSIINSGIEVVTLCDGQRYSAARCEMTQLMMSLLIFARANDESRMKFQRKAASWRVKREKAQQGGAVLGGKRPVWIGVKDGKYAVIEREAARVRDVFRNYVEGQGIYTLNKRYGIPKATIAYWLSNPVVVGTLRVTEEGKTIDLPDHYPAIIDQRTWRLAQRRKAERYIHRRQGRTGFVNLFAGLLVDHKGHRLDVARHYGFPSYVSPNGVVIQVAWLERVICVDLLRDKFVTVRYERADQESQPELDALRRKIADVQKALVDGDVVDALLPVLRDLKKRQRALESAEQKVVERLDYALIRSLFDEDDDEKRLRLREIIRDNVTQITIDRVDSRGGWYMLVKGRVELTTGGTEAFSYAYNTRRLGYVLTDKLDDRTIGTLNELPWRRAKVSPQTEGTSTPQGEDQ